MGFRVCSFARVKSDAVLDSGHLELSSSKEILIFPLGSGMKDRGRRRGITGREPGSGVGLRTYPAPAALQRSPGA